MPSRKKAIILAKKKVSTAIGGIPIGAAGSGIYSGYSLAWGEDFNGPLDLYNPFRPFGKYGTTGIYSTGSRSKSGGLSQSQDCDPFYTGSQDYNRGVPLSTNTLQQKNGKLFTTTRTANAYELPSLNSRALTAAMFHTGGYMTFSAPCIVEAYIKHDIASTTGPGGWHPTFWVLSANCLDQAGISASPGGQEYDFPESQTANYNAHGTTIGPGSGNFTISQQIYANGYHLYTLVMTAAGCSMYLDGTLVTTYTQDTTNSNRPYYILFTNHTTTPTLSDFSALGQVGAPFIVDYFRVFVPTANYPSPAQPLISLPVQQYAYGASISYTYPSTTAIFGSGVTVDYPQAHRMEDMEPGAISEGAISYAQFPSELTWTPGTRTLTGVPGRPGRLHLISTPYVAGGYIGYPARGYIDIGPRITTSTLNATVGTPFTYDLYPDGDCGTLYAKVITCTGLPSGLTFNPATNLITGTPTTAATSSITIGVTNRIGQVSAPATVNLVVSATALPAIDSSATTTYTAASGTLTMSTATANTVIVLFIKSGSNTVTVNSVTDRAGLTWTKRQSFTYGTLELEEWYAVSSAILTNNVITVVHSASGNIRLAVAAVKNVNTTTPFDSNVSLPAQIGVSGTTATRTISTNHATGIALAFVNPVTGLGTVTLPSGYTEVLNVGNFADFSYDPLSSALSSSAVTYNWTNSVNAILFVDVIQGM